MAQKWNLQDIRPAKTPPKEVRPKQIKGPSQDIKERSPRSQPTDERRFDDSDLGSIHIVDGNSARRKRIMITGAVALLILIAAFVINVLLGGADITIYPKTREVSVQANFTAHTAPQVGELGYELLSLEATGEKQVQAAGKEEVSEQAQGKIFVYNTGSASPQRLIKNTRFESPDGLIFRIQESIEVPGVTTDAEGKTVPGSIAADVFAEGTGEQYNIGPTRFTVPGLEGTDQFDTIYAESKAAFTGGFEGEKYIIDEDEYSTAKQALDMELRDKLLARLNEEKPAGFVIYDNAITFVYDELPATEYGDSLATIKERARLQVPMFEESQFASFLAEQSIPDYKEQPVTILDPKVLEFSYTDPLQSQKDIAEVGTLEFLLKGTPTIVWTFDEEEVKQDLLGKKKSETANIFKEYSSISNVKAEVRPFWANEFPDNADDIDIETIIETP